MDSLSMIFFGFLTVALNCCSAGVIPSAPVIAAPAAIAYSKAVPYNVPPHVSRIDINTKTLSAPLVAAATSIFAAPPFAVNTPAAVVAAPPTVAAHPAPVIAAYPAPAAVTAPFVAGPGFIQPSYTHPAFAAYDPTIFG